MHLVLEFELPADARLLATTRHTLAGYLEDVGADAEEQADVVLALDEACANVIRHAFPGGGGSMRLRVNLDDATVTVQVEDDGPGFDGGEVDVGEPDPGAVSGRGLRIIQALMSSVRLESPTGTGGTRLLMQRHLRAGAPRQITDAREAV